MSELFQSGTDTLVIHNFPRHRLSAGRWHHPPLWGSELFYAPTDPGQDPRHVGTIEPLWNLLDLTPAGRRSNWDEQLSYPGTDR